MGISLDGIKTAKRTQKMKTIKVVSVVDGESRD